jgi:hypothetical protein
MKSTRVTLPYDIFWTPLDWAKENCPSYITNDLHRNKDGIDPGRIDYFFGDAAEATVFALRWL